MKLKEWIYPISILMIVLGICMILQVISLHILVEVPGKHGIFIVMIIWGIVSCIAIYSYYWNKKSKKRELK